MLADLLTRSVIALGAAMPAILGLLYFPSTRNLWGLSKLGFALIAYCFPLLAWPSASPSEDGLATAAMFGLAGYALAFALSGGPVAGLAPPLGRLLENVVMNVTGRRGPLGPLSFGLLILGLLLASIAVMGFLPAFEPDPIAAKFFRGEYGPRYRPVAIPYRLAWSVMPFVLTVVAGLWFLDRGRRTAYGLLFAVGTMALALSLTREPAFIALLLAALAVVASRRSLSLSLGLAVLMISAGAVLPVVLGIGSRDLGAGTVLRQVPDVADLLLLHERFHRNNIDYSYGRTMVGGLVPFQFEWNPSVWTLTTVTNGADIRQINSGGFRLPAFAWGYFNFGYAGSFGFCFLLGINLRVLMAAYRAAVTRLPAGIGTLMVAAACVDVISLPLVNFPTISIYWFPQLAGLVAIAWRPNLTRRRSPDLSLSS